MIQAQQLRRLIDQARLARRQAYAPYSKYRVGAAVLTPDGKIFQGCNIENVSYGLTLCAERVAVCAAVAAGYRTCTAIAVVADGRPPIPCGACLQVLSEFCSPNTIVLCAAAKPGSRPCRMRVKDLLPRRFRL